MNRRHGRVIVRGTGDGEGERPMNSPILRIANSSSRVRAGFFAAGLTVTGIVLLQSVSTVVGWIVSAAV